MKSLLLAATLLGAAIPVAAQGRPGAPRVTGTLPPAELAELERVRRQVWVDWFTGDTAGLRRVLPPELVAISPDSPTFQTLEQTLAGSARYHATGAQLVRVAFDSMRVHRFGEIVVLFSHYVVETRRDGRTGVQKGRATEVFVRTDGRWVHTSWQLDVLP
jgi:ketosteroid isomerase-like protein